MILSLAVQASDGFSPLLSSRSSTRGLRVTSLQMATGVASSSADGARKVAPSVKDPSLVRNIAVVGHSHSGKTALIEWMLYDDSVITKRPAAGESFLDSDPVEASRHSSVFSHYVRVPHRDHLLEIADTPWGDFPADAVASLDGADAAIIAVSAADGVQSGTKSAYEHCTKAGIKTMIALSKMDRPFLQIDEVLGDIEFSLGTRPIPLQVPIGQGDEFEGVKPLFLLGAGGELRKNPAQDEDLQEAWTILEEAVAMTDDDLLVEYLEDSKLEPDRVLSGLRSAVVAGKVLPLVFTSAEQDAGVTELMDTAVGVFPNPVEMREHALKAACESSSGKCGLLPGVEAGFAARVLHTTIDSFGSVSVLRIISNSRDDGPDGDFHSLPHEAINLRTGEKFKMPSSSTSFALCGKDHLQLADGAHVIPGDLIALPKIPVGVVTNDIITIPEAAKEEESEISIEASIDVLTPLSRPVEDLPLMASATLSLTQAGGGKKSKKGRSAGGGSDDKLSSALAALAREDLALKVEQDPNSGQPLLRCMSGDHLQLVATRLKDRYGLEVELGTPPVQYRETLAKSVHNIEGRHKKQSGGSGQFGVCYISMEPLEEGAGVEFESKIKGGSISKPFIASVEKGVREQLESGGPLAGYPVTDVRIILTDGKMHTVDSKDIAFQSAGKLAVKAALEQGGTSLLQPMETVTFSVDDSMQGEVNTIVSRQDGYVTSSNPDASGFGLEVEAIIPSANVAGMSDALRAASAGEGYFTRAFAHYQVVPDNEIKSILENGPQSKQLMP